jgi:hypothetical protein
MDDIKQLAALTALNEMFAKGHFNICTIDTVAQMLAVNPKGEAYDILRPLHCIDYTKMPAPLREQIPHLIKQCLGVQPFFQFTARELAGHVVEVAEPEPAPRRGLLRLLGPSR